MAFFSDLFGAGGGAVPTYNIGDAQNMFQWQQGQARYNVAAPGGSLTWNPATNTQQISYSPQMQGVMNNLFGGDASGKRAEDSVFSNFQNRYAPIFAQQSGDLQNRMVNQGIPVGSEAYNRATKALSQNQADATTAAMNQAVLTGQQQRAQDVQQNLGIFNAFNPMQGYSPGAGTPNIDIYGNSYQGALNTYQTNQANAQKNAQGIVNTIGQAGQLAAMFSDARIKENLREVGRLYNGLPVYAFNFPKENVTRIGLVAQDVQQVIPEAVSSTPEGLLMVDYDLATRFDDNLQQPQPENPPQTQEAK